ncbi:MAG TPA: serine hydrolase domain-containing protein [Phycisphaerae bacterium]|nr:serine hydrolase domain-containing protein [Phycisphaerae bacterium]
MVLAGLTAPAVGLASDTHPPSAEALVKPNGQSAGHGVAERPAEDAARLAQGGRRRVEEGLASFPRKWGQLFLQGAQGLKRAATIPDRMEYHHVPGASVAVISAYKLEWVQAYGVCRAGGEAPVTTETLFQAASVGKSVTAAAALRLVEEGRLSLNGDVNQRLKSWKIPPNPYTADTPVTLRLLLSHTAGATGTGGYGYAANEACPTLLEVLDGKPPSRLEPIRVGAAPGRQYRYSSGGYSIVQQLISDVTGKPFNAAMGELVLDPLKMGHSTFEQPPDPALRALLAAEHDFDGTPLPNGPLRYPQAAAGGLWSTPSDLATFAIALMNAKRGESNAVLPSAMVSEMMQPVMFGVGLGVQVRSEGSTMHFLHVGGSVGSCCILVAYPETGKGAVVMTNSASGNTLCLEILASIFYEYEWGRLMVSF